MSELASVPLVFWIGPFRIFTLRVPVVIEDFQVVPGQGAAGIPVLRDLPRRARGIYRRSEPCLGAASPRTPGCVKYVLACYDRRLISFDRSFEEYLGNFSAKTRNTLRRKVRKFAETSGGKIAWKVYRSPKEMEEFHRLARELSSHTYQEKLFDAGMPADRNFIATLRRLAADDQVRGFILFLNGTPISYLYCPASDSRLCYDRLGFRPEFAEHSPGTVLQFLALEALFAERKFRLFDFGEGGAGQHKRLFATDTVGCANVLYLKGSLRNRALVAFHRVWSRSSVGIVNTAERLGVKRRLRRWLRGQT